MRIIGLALFLATSAISAEQHAYLSPHADQLHYQSSHKLDTTTTNRGHNSAASNKQQQERQTKSNTNDNKQQGTRLLGPNDPHHGQNGGHKGPRTTAAAGGSGNTISNVSPVPRHTHVNKHHIHDGSHGHNNNNERQSESGTLSNAEMMALAEESSSSSGCSFCPNGLTTSTDTLIPTSNESEEEVSCGMALSFANSLNPQNDELDEEECDKVLLAELFCCPTAFVDELEEEVTQDDQTPEDEVGTIVDAALGNDNFSKLVAALNAADLVDVLNGDGPFTVFAPTNEAFDALPPGAFSDIDNLKSILTYHVIGGSEVDSSSLENGQVDTVNGEPIMITISDDGTVMVNDATVTLADIRTSNGIIHAIDKVILPNGDLPSEVGTGTSDDEIEEELGSGPIACTLDVYTCPDGTTLGREGPDCEFPECPTTDTSTTTTVAGKASKAVGTKATKVKKVNDPKADKSSPKKEASDPSSTGKSGKTMDKSATPKATPSKKMSSKGKKSSKGLSMPVASTKSAKSMMFSKGAKSKSGLSMPGAPVKKGKSEKMQEDDTVVVKSKGQKESDVKPKAEKVALSMPSADQPFAKSSKLAKKGASDAMPKSSTKGDADGSSKSGKGEVKKMVDAKAIKEAGEKGTTSKTGKASIPKMSMPQSSAKSSKKKTVTKASKTAEKKAAGEKKSKGSGKSESKVSTGKTKSSKSIHTLDPPDAKAKKVSATKSSKSKSAKHSGKSGKSGSTATHPTVLPAASTEELVDTPATLPVPEEEAPIACTLDVFTCPDGTTLSREGPDCEFPECPEEEAEEEDQEDPGEEEVDESPDGTCHFCLDGLTAGADFELPTNGVFTCGQSADFAAKLDTTDDDQSESCDIIQLAQAICCPSENDKDEDLPLLMESGLLDELSSGDE